MGVKADESAGAASYDKEGHLRAVLGLTAVPEIPPGPTPEPPAAAVALFDKEGRLLFQAP